MTKFASVKTLIRELGIDKDQAEYVRSIVKSEGDENEILDTLNSVLGGHGIEFYGPDLGPSYRYGQRFLYVNMGDCYIPTIILDRLTGHFFPKSIGDHIESSSYQRLPNSHRFL